MSNIKVVLRNPRHLCNGGTVAAVGVPRGQGARLLRLPSSPHSPGPPSLYGYLRQLDG
jgi:hypothetical protein